MKSKNITPEKLLVRDAALIGDWEEVNGVPLSKVTKRDDDVALLDGLIITKPSSAGRTRTANVTRLIV